MRVLRPGFYVEQLGRLRHLPSPPEELPRLLETVAKGKSLARAWMEWKLSAASARGLVLDLGGGGSRNPELMRLGRDARVVTTDRRPDGRPSFISDLEQGLPLRDEVLDVVLLLNVLEHVYRFGPLLGEIGRTLRKGGVLYLYVPFLYHRHTARYQTSYVDDYFRFGPGALRRMVVEDGGFGGTVDVEACGYGPFTACSSLLSTAVSWAFSRVLGHRLAVWLDRLFFGVRAGRAGDAASSEWPLAYWVKAVK